jgi:4-amino-4-deoxy-L-arabinose transferase-like glycosyltransferase
VSTERHRAAMKLALAALLTAGAIVRVGGAWLFRHSYTSDQGIVALMAKHIAEGKPFPVFFYGQPYMGSLEPAVSALFCRIFGYSGFSVCLGTAAVGFLLLPLVYAMARDIAGRAAGLAALAFCIVGPGAYFHYMHSPRGGYAIVVLFGVFLLWRGGHLVYRLKSGGEARPWEYLLLGLVAGLGWWSNQLITAAILATGLLFLAVLARRAFGWHILPVVGGFVLGSLPFWVWNLHHDWASFAFMSTMKTASVSEGLRVLFLERLSAVLDTGLHDGPAAAGQLAGRFFGGHGMRVSAAMYGGAAAVALAWHFKRLFRDRWTSGTIQMTGLLLFVLVSIALFGASSFALFRTPRYLLPLVPATGIIVGVGCARLARFLRYGIAFLPVLVLVCWHTVRVSDVYAPMYRDHETFHANARQLGDDLRERGVKVVYVPYVNHSLNATLEEEFCFCAIKGERYPPCAERAERSDEVAVLGNYGYVAEFVNATGGRHETSGTGRFTFIHGFKPPPESTREIPPSLWVEARDLRGGDHRVPLTDGDSGSAWTAQPPRHGEPASLEVAFANPVELTRIRLLTRDPIPAMSKWEIWGREGAADGSWTRLAAETFITGFYWSGPRPYFGGAFYRLESRFPPASVSAFRIVLGLEDPLPVEVTEVQAFAPAGAAPVPEQHALPELSGLLAERGTSQLFCDRWVANAIRRSPGNSVATPEEKGIFMQGKTVEHVVALTPSTALLVRAEDAGLCRRTLARAGVAMRETPVGPWVLFDFSAQGAGQWVEAYRDNDSLLWAGFSCLTRNTKRHAAD